MLTVITGGSGSGKSAYAEDLLLSYGPARRIYIATMYPFDEESRRRIARHQDMRKGKGFETIECYTGLENVQIPKGSHVLLECMSNLVANEMFQKGGAGDETVKAILRGIETLSRQAARLCVVTNEIFSDCQPYGEETQRYQQYLGEINCRMAQMAEEAAEVVYGIPLSLKSERSTGHRGRVMEQF